MTISALAVVASLAAVSLPSWPPVEAPKAARSVAAGRDGSRSYAVQIWAYEGAMPATGSEGACSS